MIDIELMRKKSHPEPIEFKFNSTEGIEEVKGYIGSALPNVQVYLKSINAIPLGHFSSENWCSEAYKIGKFEGIICTAANKKGRLYSYSIRLEHEDGNIMKGLVKKLKQILPKDAQQLTR